ncbi:uncharacterized protein LOC116019666 isoform X1 [Ipomoea triloba]|uniref:uncharacterized protein LOC116019666 isoform X1 n=1 Tax=Ipomoea triloba TaxID=35885 RepID=UPI00125D8820|nr:uncharacterized protein LOC116019666 isoform X1 [Ipomoea triloba]XP_031115816.1 uncharacterized protein LOC116019666 isoform X1 [Ipomoea triloba]
MIKRRSYKLDHGDRDAPSESSSSSSDSELETKATEEDHEQKNHEEEDDDKDDYKDSSGGYKNNRVTEMQKQNIIGSSSSGYESEDSSAHEVNLDSSGPPTSDDDIETINDRKSISENHLFSRGIGESENIQHKTVTKVDDMPCERSNYILKHKSVFKCRICPRIVCLSEETLNIHLKSRRHARSEKLLKDGRLKIMLNDNGKIDREEEHSRRKEKTVQVTKRKKGFKRQRWGKRSRKTL